MKESVLSVGTVVDLELRQRVRSIAWYVLLAVSAAVLLAVSALLLLTLSTLDGEAGAATYSAIVFLVLLLGSLVTPAMSGAAVNADRDAGTLATTQVTLVTATELVLGKFLAAWTASLAFLLLAVPFLLLGVVVGGVEGAVVASSVAVTVLELGVIAAIGVGLSCLIQRPIFSVVTTYLVVAALSVGTLIAFALSGLAFQTTVTSTDTYFTEDSYDEEGVVENPVCAPPDVSTYEVPRYDLVWPVLAANPYVVLADAVPARFDRNGSPRDAFAALQLSTRSAQIAQPTQTVYNDCNPSLNTSRDYDPERILARTVPSWFVGLGLHLVLGALALVAGVRAIRTPARRLARGSRIA